MADVLTKTQRSYNMSRIKSSCTIPELEFLSILKSWGINNFIHNAKDIPGKPDIFLPQTKTAIFIDGCFWHKCSRCFIEPRSNKNFWEEKIHRNIERDKEVNSQLQRQGIKVIRLWEHELKNKNEKKLMQIKNKLEKKSNNIIKVLDLFAGAGGLSEGFIRAGCEIVGHLEMDKNACSTLVTRMMYHALLKTGRLDEYKRYILGEVSRDELIEKYHLQKERDSVICAKVGKDNYKELIKRVQNLLGDGHLDIIVGGPPCQAYSHIGRARDDHNMKWDSRKFLYRYYIEFLKAFRPKIFVFENVPGLTSSGKGRYLKEMRRMMARAGYKTDFKILNAVDFGVPQNRKRIILVGWNNKSKLTGYPEFTTSPGNYLVKDFLADLPPIHSGQGQSVVNNFISVNKPLEKLAITDNKVTVLMDHVARPNIRRDLEIYRRAVTAKQQGRNIKYTELPKYLRTHRNLNGFFDRFKVVDPNVRGSQTVVAHIGKDGHFYIHPDLKQNRSLTVREAARLQTFPDNYKFEGTRGPQFRQIGNAVPPKLSEIIAKELIKYI